MEGGDSEFANFTLPTLKAFLEARSQNASVNKQELVARDLLVSQKTTQRPFFPTLPGNFCNCNSGIMLLCFLYLFVELMITMNE